MTTYLSGSKLLWSGYERVAYKPSSIDTVKQRWEIELKTDKEFCGWQRAPLAIRM